MKAMHRDEIMRMKKTTFCIRTTRGHYIKVTREALKGFFAQFKATETSRAKEAFTCDEYTYSDDTKFLTISE